jgi:predicted metalloendopeptidase
MTRRTLFTVAAIVAITVTAAAQGGGQSGFDRANFDTAVRPQDDMFRYVNGGWLARTEIPADRPTFGTFVQLADKTETDLRALVETLAAQTTGQRSTTAQQVGDLYRSFMDEAAIDRAGVAPIAARLAEIDRVSNTTELASLLGRMSMYGIPGPVGGFVEGDVGDPTRNTLYLSQGGTALPDRDYYLLEDPRFVEARTKYAEYLERIFTLAGRPNAAADATTVLALETALAKIQWTNVESRDAVKTYNPFPVATVAEKMPGFDWMAWAAPQGIDKTREWVIQQPSFFTSFAAMVPTTPLTSWKAWLAAQVITDAAPLLNAPIADAAFDFFGRTLTGQQAQRERWKRGVQLINGSVGEALGQLYVEKHFPPAARARMQTLIDNLIEAYRQSITGLEWMTPATRKEALAKLAKFTSKIGYPERWRDYSRLRIVAGDLIGNVERARILESEYQIGKLNRPVDRFDWLMTPQTVNAYYNPAKNEIVFPAAILQPPFFDLQADDAVNYGAIGGVIGHEIGHGFDDQGSRYDGDGRLRNWWTPADETEFRNRTQALVRQFSAYSPLPGLNINGELTLGENIGDLGGVSIAHRAWTISRNGKPAPEIDGLTGEQRFFMGWVQAWRAKARDQYLQRQVTADPHAWAEFRANGPLSNIDAFYAAFNVQPGDRMYKAPADRVKIW